MTFKIGDEVICINTRYSVNQDKHAILEDTVLILGNFYIVRDIINSLCCEALLLDVGVFYPPDVVGIYCICGFRTKFSENPTANYKLASRFIKLDKRIVEKLEFMKEPALYLEEK